LLLSLFFTFSLQPKGSILNKNTHTIKERILCTAPDTPPQHSRVLFLSRGCGLSSAEGFAEEEAR
jgi:hypothetical protein